MREPIPDQFQQYVSSELKYIRKRVDDLYNRHYLLHANDLPLVLVPVSMLLPSQFSAQ
jgi:hypothetical protein